MVETGSPESTASSTGSRSSSRRLPFQSPTPQQVIQAVSGVAQQGINLFQGSVTPRMTSEDESQVQGTNQSIGLSIGETPVAGGGSGGEAVGGTVSAQATGGGDPTRGGTSFTGQGTPLNATSTSPAAPGGSARGRAAPPGTAVRRTGPATGSARRPCAPGDAC